MNEQKLCSSYRELIEFVFRLTRYENTIFSCDQLIIVLIDHKQNLSCLTKSGKLSPLSYIAQMQLTKFQNHRIFSEGKQTSISEADV